MDIQDINIPQLGKVRQQGGSLILTLDKDIIRAYDIKKGDLIQVVVKSKYGPVLKLCISSVCCLLCVAAYNLYIIFEQFVKTFSGVRCDESR